MEAKFINLNQYQVLEEKLKKLLGNVVHVSLQNRRNKVVDAPSVIKGVYSRFVCVTSKVNNYEENFTISYTDILRGLVSIKEIIL